LLINPLARQFWIERSGLRALLLDMKPAAALGTLDGA
jgi:hypothetical protein